MLPLCWRTFFFFFFRHTLLRHYAALIRRRCRFTPPDVTSCSMPEMNIRHADFFDYTIRYAITPMFSLIFFFCCCHGAIDGATLSRLFIRCRFSFFADFLSLSIDATAPYILASCFYTLCSADSAIPVSRRHVCFSLLLRYAMLHYAARCCCYVMPPLIIAGAARCALLVCYQHISDMRDVSASARC